MMEDIPQQYKPLHDKALNGLFDNAEKIMKKMQSYGGEKQAALLIDNWITDSNIKGGGHED